MLHSVENYLRRLTTKDLRGRLLMLEINRDEDVESLEIKLIQEILAEREREMSGAPEPAEK